MANRRVLVKRKKAVGNIRKITRTMQLIATARFQAAFTRAVASRPYTEKLWGVATELGLPRLLLVNRMDRERASFERCLGALQKSFGREVTSGFGCPTRRCSRTSTSRERGSTPD